MKASDNFTEGKIFGPLMKFALPVIAALILQSLYGAVDLLVVGQFASSPDVSAVSTGSQIMQTLTNVIASLAMGSTILLGQLLGEKKPEKAGKAVGASIVFFLSAAVVLSIVMLGNTTGIARIMHAPASAFDMTCSYVRICSGGLIFIVAYNLLGSVFRGLGNSRLPLLSVAIAAVINIFGDLFLVAVLHMGAAGAAVATVASQAISVIISFAVIRKMDLPFVFGRQDIRWNGTYIRKIFSFGFPLALSDFLVGISFLIIVSIINVLGVTASAGVGVAEKVCAFIMLVPSAFGQSISAFTAQNYGAGKMERARKGLRYVLATSFAVGAFMGWLSFFHGNMLCGIFSKDPAVIAAGWEYLKAYAIDCLLTSIFFVLAGYFNGCGYTKFVMMENIIGAVGIRVPVSWIMSSIQPVSLFRIGLATPSSSFVQVVLCTLYYFHIKKGQNALS